MTTRGCVYLASGRVYNEAARWSLETLRETGYADGICVFTDDPDGYPGDVETRPLGKSVTHPGDSILDERHMVYDKNLYVDSDTVWLRNPRGAFELLDNYEMVVETGSSTGDGYGATDQLFPSMNTTVVGYTSADVVLDVFQHWSKIKSADDSTNMNRYAFTQAVFLTDPKWINFPREFVSHIKSHHIAHSRMSLVHYQDLPNPVVEEYVSRIADLAGAYVKIEAGDLTFITSDRSYNMHKFGSYVYMLQRDILRLVDKLKL